MRISNCSVKFRKFTGMVLEDFAEGVKAGLYVNDKIFLLPPVTLLVFEALIDTYSDARKIYDAGGTAQYPAYKAALDAIVAALNILAPYVDKTAVGDVSIIKLAGFVPTFVKAAGRPGASFVQFLTLVSEKNLIEQLTSDCEVFPFGTSFVGILCEGGPLPADVTVDAEGAVVIPSTTTIRIFVHTSKQRKKVYRNLKSGTYYYCYYFVINNQGVSVISNQAKTMCQ